MEETIMNTVIKNTDDKMKKSVDHLETEFSEIRAGRANPAVLDKIRVDYYGAPTAINQLAAVSVTEARTLVIQPWDTSVLRSIEKAIQTSDIGINPQNDGKIIRMIFPPLTEDRRKEIVKEIAKMGEDTKVAIRSIRREAMEKLKSMKKKSEITEDDQKNCSQCKNHEPGRQNHNAAQTDSLHREFQIICLGVGTADKPYGVRRHGEQTDGGHQWNDGEGVGSGKNRRIDQALQQNAEDTGTGHGHQKSKNDITRRTVNVISDISTDQVSAGIGDIQDAQNTVNQRRSHGCQRIQTADGQCIDELL